MTTDDAVKLLPCAFCGASDEGFHLQAVQSQDLQGNPKDWSVECAECAAFGPTAATKEEAEALWNVRPTITTADRLARGMGAEFVPFEAGRVELSADHPLATFPLSPAAVAELDAERDRAALAIVMRHTSLGGHVNAGVVAAEAFEAGCRAALRAPPSDEREGFQARVHNWVVECFGIEAARDRVERNHRFLEEALELAQACDCTASEAHQLVDYVYGRPKGDPHVEIGDVMNTLAALATAHDIDLKASGEAVLVRCLANVETTRAKWLKKPKHSPLPEAPAAERGTVDRCDLAVAIAECFMCQPKEMPYEDRADELAEAVIAYLGRTVDREAVIRECAAVAAKMREKWGDPIGTDYAQGAQDQGIRIEAQILALIGGGK